MRMKFASISVLLASFTGVLAGCPLPSSYNWTSSGPLAQPIDGWAALREFTHVVYKGKNLVYATAFSNRYDWGTIAFGPFSDWSEMGSANQTLLSERAISPSLFFFRPKNIWVLAFQWGKYSFSYKVSKDPSDLNSWSLEQPLFTGTITNSSTGPLDSAVIADDKNIYLFFCGYNGAVYRSSMPLHDFPGNFGTASTIVIKDATQNALEGVQVYTVSKGQYLMVVQAAGSQGRFFRALTATSLDGSWTPLAATEANPFAGKLNSDATWTRDVGSGELLRSNPDQTMKIDPCHLQFLYQGRNPTSSDFSIFPHRPGLLTLKL